MIQSRRSFLRFSLLAAPAIVCAANLMPVRAFIMPEEINTQEIIAILNARLDDPVRNKLRAEIAAYGRGTYGLERSIQQSHVGLAAQEPKIIPPLDHVWGGWK